MTRKDYVMLAGIIKDCNLIPTLNNNKALASIQADMLFTVASQLAYKLEQDNPRFDRAKFLTACGLKEAI
jgi:hypothetical protein